MRRLFRVGQWEALALCAQCRGVDLPRGVHLIVDVERRDRARPAAVDRQVRQKAGGLAWLYTVVERSGQVASVAPQIESGALVRVLEDWCPPFAGYFLYYPSRRQQPAALSALIETLRL
jgi:DNA-binding transcriptional LysR family regulator